MKSHAKCGRIGEELLTVTQIIRSHFPKMRIQSPFGFASHTTIGCGGTAELAVYPTAEEFPPLLRFLEQSGIAFCFLGAGANVLPSDGHFSGVVVRFSALRERAADGDLLFVGAGTTGGELCTLAKRRNLSGFEPFTGIPMTVGGGITMNAGVQDRHFSDVVRFVLAAEHGTLRLFSLQECEFSQKHSVFQSGIAVLGAVLQGTKSFEEEIDRRTCYYRLRRAHLPKGRSMGCTFVNPEGIGAGRLIESCGLKGLKIGGAVVSDAHANFILNEGGTAADVRTLIETVKRQVKENTGVELLEEIRYLP